MSSSRRIAAMAVSLALFSPAVLAQDQDQKLDPITVSSKPRDALPYDDFLAGLAIFHEDHRLAPTAEMKFQVIPRHADVALSELHLQLVVPDRASEDIAVAADGTFDIPVHPELAGRGAEVRSNLPAGSLHWRDRVLSVDQPPDTRRMGDLRLECEVKEVGQLNRNDLPFFERLFSSRSKDECYSSDEHFFLAARPLARVSLDDGTHHADIAPDRIAESSQGHLIPRSYSIFEPWLRERAYSPPLQDTDWGDDTRITFTYSDAGDASITPIS